MMLLSKQQCRLFLIRMGFAQKNDDVSLNFINPFIFQIRFIRNELLSLKDMGFLRGKFEEGVNWKALALNSIALLKDKIKVINYLLLEFSIKLTFFSIH